MKKKLKALTEWWRNKTATPTNAQPPQPQKKEYHINVARYTIYGWMITDLKLSGYELHIYALIYSYNVKKKAFGGTIEYIAEWLGLDAVNGLHREHINDCINNLIRKGHIRRATSYSGYDVLLVNRETTSLAQFKNNS